MSDWIRDAKRVASMHRIAPCPVCGGEGHICGDHTCGYTTFWVFCTECGHEVDRNIPSVSLAIREWNRCGRRPSDAGGTE